MFVFNVKVSKMKIFKMILAIMAIICLSLAGMGILKIYQSGEKNQETIFGGDCMPSGDVAYLTDENYTNVLKEVHENLENYVGQKICYTGYVYRVPEIEKNQFILARDMNLENMNQTVIVGFLCSCENANDFDTYSWVRATGTIEKGNYFGEIPCIHITEIEKCDAPENSIVPEPKENFIQTAVIY